MLEYNDRVVKNVDNLLNREPDDKEVEERLEIWEGRRYIYGILAVVFAGPPEEGWFKDLLSPAFAKFVECLAISAQVKESLALLLIKVQGEKGQNDFREQTCQEYERLFMVPIKKSMVSLGAASYLPEETDLSKRRAELESWYTRLGFDWREYLAGTNGVWPNEPEHLLLVLTLLTILADEVATSIQADDGLAADIARVGQGILNMIQEWVPQAMTRIEERTSNLFYLFFSSFLKEFIENDDFIYKEIFAES